jgi:hypothetical protein
MTLKICPKSRRLEQGGWYFHPIASFKRRASFPKWAV